MKYYNNEEIEAFRKRAHDKIPSGAHTYSKADDQFSSNAPAFIQKGEGAICYDYKGESYIDYGMGIFSVSLGHAHPKVIEAVSDQLKNGNSFTRPTILEGELAEQLCDMIPCAEMVKFAKNGSDVTSAAIRLARAYTSRDYIITIKEQPFHSFNDWFIGSTSKAGGVPNNIRTQTLKIPYNNIETFKDAISAYPNKIACVLMEPVTFDEPKAEYLNQIRELCTKHGIVLIFDEIITGFRWNLKGAQHFFNVTPDLATFGKGMANGFACAAIMGKKEIMELGNSSGDVFLLSCTYGSELVGLTAAKKTIEIFQEENVIDHIWSYGKDLIVGLSDQIQALNLENQLKIEGYPCRPNISFLCNEGAFSFELKTLFIQEMVKQNILMERICVSYAHNDKLLKSSLKATAATFEVIQKGLNNNNISEIIDGEIVKPVFT